MGCCLRKVIKENKIKLLNKEKVVPREQIRVVMWLSLFLLFLEKCKFILIYLYLYSILFIVKENIGKDKRNMEKYVKDIKIGNEINRHEKGWQRVVGIRKSYFIYITLENGEELYYREDEKLFVIE